MTKGANKTMMIPEIIIERLAITPSKGDVVLLVQFPSHAVHCLKRAPIAIRFYISSITESNHPITYRPDP